MLAEAGDGGPLWGWVILAVPFFLGIASGGQSIYAKLGGDWLHVLRTVPGWVYWLSRGAVPVACYCVVYSTKLESRHSVTAALLCGFGSEAVLRSRFFIGSDTAGAKSQDVYKGVFDLVEWYQNLFLRAASNRLADGRLKFINALVGGTTDFPALCARANGNAGSFAMSKAQLHEIIEENLLAFQQETAVKNGLATAETHRYHASLLAYALLDVTDRSSLTTLLTI